MLRRIWNDFRIEWLINFEFVNVFSSSYVLMNAMVPLFVIRKQDF